ncbi:cadherin-like beta sandwich domain-containing protein [Brucepastera parasyntrophica]|uniref:cadherin-like beta sandwich domain-containing protein n=1 Tax=Brucepastera parasyntrophica TaxID=2880008 RepID=UPI002109ABAF|nr:cadherin-like beta sandwich domain-containing protein [Brucepastera parasyntrophica]ULQ60752.1 cadherin-like beta sandwich domain-containing protein [Brucepastera parasyntrophica]
MKRKSIGLICMIALIAGGLFTSCENPFFIALLMKTRTVTYHANGGTGTAPKKAEVEDGESITAPAGTGLTRTGFTFMGWNTRADGNGTLYPSGSKIKVSGDLKLYAHWASSGKTITAGDISLAGDLAGGSVVVDEENKTITITAPYGTDETDLALDIRVDGAVVSPGGGESQDFTDPVTYTVTAEDGTSQDYTVTVTVRAPSSNAALSVLTVSEGTLTPDFDEAITAYTVSVPDTVSSITVTGTKADSTASLSSNSGAPQNLETSPTVITLRVTAQDGSVTDYEVTVTLISTSKAITGFTIPGAHSGGDINEAAKTIAITVPYGTDVTGLAPTITHTGVSISPASGAAQNFTGSVPYTVTAEDGSTAVYTVTVTVAANTAKAITGFAFETPAVTGDINEAAKTIAATVPYGTDVTALIPTVSHTGERINPASGVAQNFTGSVSYTVTAADDSTQVYTVTVSAASLTSIELSGSYKTQYKIGESLDTTGLVITGTDSEGNSMTIPASSCAFTGFDSASAGNKTVTITVTGTAVTKTFGVTVLSNNADLSNLTVSTGTLSPAFDANTTSYTVSVPYTVTAITVTGTAADGAATVSNSGVAQNLNVGSNPITITVTAEDGETTKDYTVTVSRTAANTDADLSNLTVSVANSVTSITVTGTAADGSASVSANSGVAQPLNVGANTITIRVTAQDTTTQDYIVVVTRAASNNANLSGITLSDGVLSPTFNANTTAYTVSVPYSTASITVTETLIEIFMQWRRS